MKRMIFWALLVLMSVEASAQTSARKEARMEAKERQRLEDSTLHAQAFNALTQGSFVMQATRILFKRGQTASVSSNTNFISSHAGEALVQVVFNSVARGANGIGGITVKGNVTDISVRQDKRGYSYYSMQVQGVGLSARVDLTLFPNGNRANAVITPNFNSNRITLEGVLVPYEMASVYQGRSY